MRDMFRKILAIAMTVALLTTLSAVAEPYETCLNPSASEPIYVTLNNLDLDGTLKEGEFDGQSISIVTLQTNYGDALKEYAGIFEKLTGCKVSVEVFAEGDGAEKVRMALASGGVYDMMMIPAPDLINYASADYIMDMSDLIGTYASDGYDIDDFAKGVFDAYSRYGDQIISIPFYPNVQLLYYRKDLFEDEQNKVAFKAMYNRELAVPVTPEEMAEVSAFFTKSINPDSPVDYGFVTHMDGGDSSLWVNRLGYYGGCLLDDDFNVGFADGSGVSALADFKSLMAYMPEDMMSFDWDLLYSFFANGGAAMCEAWPGLAKTCEADASFPSSAPIWAR